MHDFCGFDGGYIENNHERLSQLLFKLPEMVISNITFLQSSIGITIIIIITFWNHSKVSLSSEET